MKKLRLMLVTLACLFGTILGPKASADTYYFQKPDGWDKVFVFGWGIAPGTGDYPGTAATKYDKTYNGKDVYYYTVNGTPGGMIFNNGKGKNGNQTNDITEFTDGAIWILGEKDGDLNEDGNQKYSYTKVDNPTFDSETPNPPTPPVTEYRDDLYLRGGFNSWGCDENYKLEGTNGVYTRTFAKLGTDEFKIGSKAIKEGTEHWLVAYSTGKSNMVANTNYDCPSTIDDNMQLASELENVTVKLDLTGETPTITFITDDTPVPPTPTYPEKLYLIGPSFGGWGTFSETYSATPENGVYTWSFTEGFTTDEFKVSGLDYIPAYTNQKTDMTANQVYDCPESDSQTNMKANISAQKVTVKFDMTGETPTLTFVTDDTPTPPTPGKVNPDGPRTLYVSFGQERILSGKRDEDHKPQIHFGSNTIDPANDPRMTKVYTEADSPIWSFELSDEQYALGDAVLYFELNDGNMSSYRIGRAGNRDEYNWTKYIYYVDPVKEGDTGDDSQNKVARQSYITKDQFTELKYGAKTKLYITGQGFANDKGDTLQGWAIRPGKGGVMALDGQDGVFSVKIKQGGELADATPATELPDGQTEKQKGAKFKMGWIRPYDWYLANCSNIDINEDRCWATFNLGIVGIDESHSAIGNGTNQVQIVRGTGNDLNTEVFCTPGRTIPVSRYNQSDWFIREKYIGKTTMGEGDEAKPVEYTLVVDLEPTCNTVTLLYFNPEPVLTSSDVKIDHVELTAAQAKAIRERSEDETLDAEAVNGPAYMRFVNVASANGQLKFDDYDKVKGTSPAGLNYSYETEFEIRSGSNQAGVYTPDENFKGTANISLPGIAVGNGEMTQLGARAKFTATSGLHFHTKYVSAEVQAPGTSSLPALAVNVEKCSYSYGSNNTGDPKAGIPVEESWYTLGAYALLGITAPQTNEGNNTDLFWYGDFKLQLADENGYHAQHPELANGGEIVIPGHHTTTLTGEVKGEPLAGFTPWTEGGDYTDANNWAACMNTATAWPVHLPEVVKVTRKYADDATGYWDFTEEGLENSVQIKGSVSAVYPFLIEPNAAIVATSDNSRMKAPGNKLTIDDSKAYELSYQPVSTPFTFSLGAGQLTGVKDITAPAADNDCEVEYYNIQGVRMQGELAPGVYIRRHGASVEKVIIR